MGAERRRAPRVAFRHGHLPPRAKVRPGSDVIVVDLSTTGALVEGHARFRPGSRCELALGFGNGDLTVRARVARCFVARLERMAPVRYRAAIAFETLVDVSSHWQSLKGYEVAGNEPAETGGGVVDTHTPAKHRRDEHHLPRFPHGSSRR